MRTKSIAISAVIISSIIAACVSSLFKTICYLYYKFVFFFTLGNSTYCWISDKTAIAVTMVTPLSFALIFNMACLVKNARAIRRVQQVCHITAMNFLRVRFLWVSKPV